MSINYLSHVTQVINDPSVRAMSEKLRTLIRVRLQQSNKLTFSQHKYHFMSNGLVVYM